VNCADEVLGADGTPVVVASCCPGGHGFCSTGGSSDLPYVGAVCCKPELEFLNCLKQFAWAIGITDAVDCLGYDGQDSGRDADCSAVTTIEECNELCRAVVG
jgi:hypothetical protein